MKIYFSAKETKTNGPSDEIIMKNGLTDNSFFAILKRSSELKPKEVFESICVMTGLFPDSSNAGHDVATLFLYKMKKELEWILFFLTNNQSLFQTEKVLTKWISFFDGRIHLNKFIHFLICVKKKFNLRVPKPLFSIIFDFFYSPI